MRQKLLDMMPMRNGHFRLESGHHGELWLDLDHLFVQPAHLVPFIAELGQRLTHYGIDGICGPLTGGAFVAQMIATDLAVEFYYAERAFRPTEDKLYSTQYSIPTSLRGAIDGKRIAIVDDAINAGSAVRATLADVEACGAHPVVIGTLLQLGSRGAEFASSRHMPLETLAHISSDTWEPTECPLCRTGVTLEDHI